MQTNNKMAAVSLSFPITTLMNAASIWIGIGIFPPRKPRLWPSLLF